MLITILYSFCFWRPNSRAICVSKHAICINCIKYNPKAEATWVPQEALLAQNNTCYINQLMNPGAPKCLYLALLRINSSKHIIYDWGLPGLGALL